MRTALLFLFLALTGLCQAVEQPPPRLEYALTWGGPAQLENQRLINKFVRKAGITDLTDIRTVTFLVLQLKTAGLWSKLDVIYPFVGGTALAHSLNLKDPDTFQITWNGGVTHDEYGITGDGSTGWGNTGFNSHSSAQNSSRSNFSLTVYQRSTNQGTGTTRYYIGAVATNVATGLLWDGSSEIGYIAAGNVAHQAPASFTLTDHTGVLTVSVSGSNSQVRYFRNGVQVGGTAGAFGFFGDAPYALLARNNIGSRSGFSGQNLAFAAIGKGFTATEALQFSRIIHQAQVIQSREITP